ncbi:ArsC/Spx/MgsR family protein, partial [Bacillus paralicheniformis]
LASDGMLIKRPLVTDGQKVTLGFKESDFEKTWK